MINLEQLRTLVVLNEQGSFTKAGESLHKAQSAVTYAIKSLESELGLKLLDRSGYRADFTPEGKAILEKAKEMLELAQEITGLSELLRDGMEPRINIVAHGLLPLENIMPLLNESLSLRYPTQISLRVEILSGIGESIEAFQPEIVITPFASIEIPQNYNAVRIGSIALIPVVSPKHPLAKVTPPIPLHALREHVHLIVTDSARSPKPLDFLIIGAKEQWKFPDFYTRREGLRAGLGFAWMPTYLVDKDIAEGKLKPILLEGQNVYHYDVGVVYRRNPGLGPAGRYLLDLLQESDQILPKVPGKLTAMYA